MIKLMTSRLALAVMTLLVTVDRAMAGIAGIDSGASDAAPTGAKGVDLFGGGSLFEKISNTLIYLVGAVAVIMLIIGGFRYVVSQGSSEQVKQAKDTILYGIIGIVVAILAYAIVHFIATAVGGSPDCSATPKPAGCN